MVIYYLTTQSKEWLESHRTMIENPIDRKEE